MKALKDYLISESGTNVEEWSASAVQDFVQEIINNNYVDDDDDNDNYGGYGDDWDDGDSSNNDYYDDQSDYLEQWFKENRNKKFICYTSTGEYWGLDSNEYIECKPEDIPDAEGPEDGCAIEYEDSTIYGKSVEGGYGGGDYFDFMFKLVK